MLKNYFKIGWRNLRRNKAYAGISIVGLALGIACGILIFTLISYHLSFDNFHKNPDRIFRFYTEWDDQGVSKSVGLPQPFGKTFRNDYSLGEKTARIIDFHQSLITIHEGNQVKKFREENGVAFTEPEFFDIMNYPLIKGDKKSVLQQPNEALITETAAIKFFGNTNVIGKVFRLDNKLNFTITGLLKDLPDNTDRNQNIYVSYSSLDDFTNKKRESNWQGVYSGSQAYTLLKASVSVNQAEAALASIVKKVYKGRDLKVWHFHLQPLNDIHFNPELNGFADKKYLWALFFIGVFLILTACVNFVNLATAQALNRAKEVGIRKVLGSLPFQLFWQFIAETAIITLFAVVISIVLAALTLPLLNDLFESQMTFQWLPLGIFIVGISILVVFLSGSYPGLVLARFQPILALKSKLSQKHIGGFSLRRILIVTQFSIAQLLIIGAIIVVSQLHYSQNSDLGFNKQAVVLLPVPDNNKAKLQTMLNQLNQVPGVTSTSLCYQAPASQSNNTTGLVYDNRAEEEHWGVNTKNGDQNYLKTFGLKLVAGRNLNPADTATEFLVNETFAKKLNLKSADVIGKMLAINGKTTKAPIVGVVKDFYTYSFHEEIDAICIMSDYRGFSTCAIKMNMKNASTALASFEKIWNNTFPQELYSYAFFDDNIKKFYELDNILLKLVEGFALIAIFISCLGLYGMVSFMAVRKTKEIGVRKVLGAGIQSILWLFGKEFCRLLLIAFGIAAPLAWLTMNNYLQGFKYRITIGPEIFLMAIAITFIITTITVGYRAIRAALDNPVRSLRSE